MEEQFWSDQKPNFHRFSNDRKVTIDHENNDFLRFYFRARTTNRSRWMTPNVASLQRSSAISAARERHGKSSFEFSDRFSDAPFRSSFRPSLCLDFGGKDFWAKTCRLIPLRLKVTLTHVSLIAIETSVVAGLPQASSVNGRVHHSPTEELAKTPTSRLVKQPTAPFGLQISAVLTWKRPADDVAPNGIRPNLVCCRRMDYSLSVTNAEWKQMNQTHAKTMIIKLPRSDSFARKP